MISVRYSAGKSWANFACAIAGGLVVVIVLGLLLQGGVLVGGIVGLIAVLVMLLPGVVKRSSRQEPFLTVDGRGITVAVAGVGTLPWSQIKGTRFAGVPWVTGLRLVVDYAGPRPKLGFMDKLNWAVYAKQKGESVSISIGFLELTDQSREAVAGALARNAAGAA
jgi:hypothetical protein